VKVRHPRRRDDARKCPETQDGGDDAFLALVDVQALDDIDWNDDGEEPIAYDVY
jgi:hypothetical protein